MVVHISLEAQHFRAEEVRGRVENSRLIAKMSDLFLQSLH